MSDEEIKDIIKNELSKVKVSTPLEFNIHGVSITSDLSTHLIINICKQYSTKYQSRVDLLLLSNLEIIKENHALKKITDGMADELQRCLDYILPPYEGVPHPAFDLTTLLEVLEKYKNIKNGTDTGAN